MRAVLVDDAVRFDEEVAQLVPLGAVGRRLGGEDMREREVFEENGADERVQARRVGTGGG